MPLNIILLAAYLALMAYTLPQWAKQPWPSDGTACTAPLGHPESFELNGQTYHFQYDAKGRVLSRRGDFEEIRFHYVWQNDRPIHITRLYGQQGQPEWVRLDWHFIYNSHSDLAYARDENGREAWYGYNDSRELIWVKNTNGTWLDIAYDPVCHLPSRLSENGAGSVTVAYDSDCKIEKQAEDDSSDQEADFLHRFDSSLDLMAQPNLDVFH